MDTSVQIASHAIPFSGRRDRQCFPGSEYLLPSDKTEKERLDFQHRIFKELQGNKLVLAPVTIPPEGKILDSGTGTGVWLLDVMDEVPASVELVSIDIEARLFPVEDPRVLARGNMRFAKESITSLPQDYSGKFTLINQRLLMAALQLPQWEQAIREMHRALAPGGWAQLLEIGRWTANERTAQQAKILQVASQSRGLVSGCALRIEGWMKEAGFVDVVREEGRMPLGSWAGKVGQDSSRNISDVFRAFKGPVLDAGGLGLVSSEEEYDNLADELERDWEENPGAYVDFHVTCGKKA